MVDSCSSTARPVGLSRFDSCGRLACKCCSSPGSAASSDIFNPLSEGREQLALSVQALDPGKDWGRLLSQLPAVGSGLVISQNDAATLCSRRPYPSLYFASHCRTKGSNSEAGVWVDGRGLGAARVLHFKRGAENFYRVEFVSAAGRVIHAFELTTQSDLQKFRDWMRVHRSGAAHPHAPARDVREIPNRKETTGDTAAVIAVVKECARRAIAIRATVCAGPVTQRAVFTPRSLQPVDDWWFASDETAGLHLRGEAIARARVSPELGEQYCAVPALYAESAGHAPALILELGNAAHASEWNAIVHSLV
jgi:hypothetical protein